MKTIDILKQFSVNETNEAGVKGLVIWEEDFQEIASRIEGLGEWMSVNDKLPADNVLVLAYSEKYNGTYPFLAYCANGKWYDPDFDSDFNVIPDPITSWIELPEPPKK